MLSNRRAQASPCVVEREIKTQRGCPQVGILSPSLWNLVDDDILTTLSEQEMYAHVYTDDTVVLIRGKIWLRA